jgi:hypothetical protein
VSSRERGKESIAGLQEVSRQLHNRHLMWSLPVPNDSSPQTLHLPASITLHCGSQQNGSAV